jgi:hypothetical protein
MSIKGGLSAGGIRRKEEGKRAKYWRVPEGKEDWRTLYNIKCDDDENYYSSS